MVIIFRPKPPTSRLTTSRLATSHLARSPLTRFGLYPCRALLCLVWMLALILAPFAAPASALKRDEEIIFFPTAAHQDPISGTWMVPVHAWVFEPEEDSLMRAGTLAALAAALELNEDAAQHLLFRQRARWFLVDNEAGKQILTSLSPIPLGPTGANGQAERIYRLDPSSTVAPGQWLSFTALLPAGDRRAFRGRVQLVAAQGLSVISDIDDTVKISQVTDTQALLENTFVKPFQAAPGMIDFYDSLARQGAVFHYVSSSPWQLYPALAAFFRTAGLPPGSFHLKSVRLKDDSLLNLFASSTQTKPPIIESLLARWPHRRFILIGDSGEHDPEIYGAIARKYPDRIDHIYIRPVTPEDAAHQRYTRAFRDIAASKWSLVH